MSSQVPLFTLTGPSQVPVIGLVNQAGTAAADLSSSVSATNYNLRPTGVLHATWSRMGSTMANSALLVSQRLHMVAIDIPAGTPVTSISFVSATTAAVTPANQWFGIFSAARVALGLTTDDTTGAWAANTVKTLALTTPYTTTVSGLHYLGIMVNAATPPSLTAVVGLAHVHALVPVTNGFSSTGLTTPPALPYTAGAIAQQAAAPWAYVS